MAIELVTFGGLHILDAESELDWLAGQRSRAALLVYLAIERRVSRETLISIFWPESDTASARHALRQSLYQLKKALQANWVESTAHELIVTGPVADVHQFTDAIERSDLEKAVRLYRGPFLDGVHLADLTAWEQWVDKRRNQYARAFRKANRDLLDRKVSSGDMTSAVSLAEHWTQKDPLDDEAEHRLIEVLSSAGQRTDAISQYESYLKRLESEGLQPSAATLELGKRLESRSADIVEWKAPPRVPDPSAENSARRASLAAVMVSVAVMLAALAIWSFTGKSSTSPSAPDRLAILPLSVHGSPSAAYLREGMASLLARALDGAGTLKPSDIRATLGAAGQESQPAAIAGKVGAGMYLLGDVVEAGGRLQIQATIYRNNGDVTARGVVTGSEDSVFALADELAAQLLADLSDPESRRLVRTASVTTSSLDAFKKYLEGDYLMRAGRFERAADSYQAAIDRDSAFAVAYYRLGLAREWAPLPGEDKAANAAARFSSRLSSRDRKLLDAFRAWRSGDAVRAEREYREILAQYPDDVDAWFQLGEIQFHHGPLIGQRIQESEEAWRNVLKFEKQNAFAVTHLVRIAIVDGRLDTVDSLLRGFPAADLNTDRRLVELSLLRAVARGDTATATQLSETIKSWGALAAWRVGVFLTAFTQHPSRMRPIVHDLIEPAENGALRAEVLWFASLLDLANGKVSASRAALAEASQSERTERVGRRRTGFDAMMDWYAMTLPLPYPDSTLANARTRVTAFRADSIHTTTNPDTELGGSIHLEPLKQYTIGVLSVRMRDARTAGNAAKKLESFAQSKNATSLTQDLDRGLRARLAWADGRSDEALQLLDAQEYTDTQGDISAMPFAAHAAERYLKGEILVTTGRYGEALKMFQSLGDGSVSEIPLRALSHLRQAQLYERLRSPSQARIHYAQFRRLWSGSDSILQAFGPNRQLTIGNQ